MIVKNCCAAASSRCNGRIRRINFSTEISSASYCRNLVRNYDFENYLCGLLYPNEFRDTFFAIYSLKAELSGIKEQCHGNLMAGRMRFMWWREVIDGMCSSTQNSSVTAAVTGHPVAHSLNQAVRKHSLTRRWLEHLIEVMRITFVFNISPSCFWQPIFV